MDQKYHDLFSTHFSHSKSYFTPPMPADIPSSLECNWNYEGCDDIGGDYIDYRDCKDFYHYNTFDCCSDFNYDGCFNFRQPRRRRPILPRSNFGRPMVRPETATTYKCSFYPKSYSKRRAIKPRNYIPRACGPPQSCTMNQLSYTYRLRHRFWY